MSRIGRGALALTIPAVLMACIACGPGSDAATQAPDSTEPTPATTWNVNDWKPSKPVVARRWTEEEKLAWRTKWLKRSADEVGLKNPPAVALVRWVSLEDDIVAQCVTEQGFPAKRKNGGLAFDGVSTAQEQALNLAVHVCQSKYSYEPKYLQEWTPEQLEVLYEYRIQYLMPCIASFGHPSSQEVPTKEKFISTFHTPQRIDWYPERVVESSILPEDADMRAACPANPPAKYFYG